MARDESTDVDGSSGRVANLGGINVALRIMTQTIHSTADSLHSAAAKRTEKFISLIGRDTEVRSDRVIYILATKFCASHVRNTVDDAKIFRVARRIVTQYTPGGLAKRNKEGALIVGCRVLHEIRRLKEPQLALGVSRLKHSSPLQFPDAPLNTVCQSIMVFRFLACLILCAPKFASLALVLTERPLERGQGIPVDAHRTK